MEDEEEEGKRRRGFTGGEELGGGGDSWILSVEAGGPEHCAVSLTDKYRLSSFWLIMRIWEILEFLVEQNVLFTSVLLRV